VLPLVLSLDAAAIVWIGSVSQRQPGILVSRLEPTESPPRSFRPVAAGAAVAVHLAACLVSYGGTALGEPSGRHRPPGVRDGDRRSQSRSVPGLLRGVPQTAGVRRTRLLGADHYFPSLQAADGGLRRSHLVLARCCGPQTTGASSASSPSRCCRCCSGTSASSAATVPALLLVATLCSTLLGRGRAHLLRSASRCASSFRL
jgi:hypothetical protein